MFNRTQKYFFILFFFSSINFSLIAQNVNDALRFVQPGISGSARSLGMGNAFHALSDDVSGMMFNPAGTALVKKLEFAAGLDYFKFNNDAEFFGNQSEYSNSSTNLNQLGFIFPFPTVRGSMVVGIAYNRISDLTAALKFDGFNNDRNSMIQSLLDTDVPYDLYLTDNAGNTIIDGRLNQSGTILNSGALNNWTVNFATEVYHNLFVGGNLNFISGDYSYNREYYEDDTKNIYAGRETAPGFAFTNAFETFFLNSILKQEISGWDFKLGAIYQFGKLARIGTSIQFPKFLTIDEEFLVDGYSQFGDGTRKTLDPENYSDKVKYDIISPFSITAAISVSAVGLIVSAEANLIDYSQIEFKNPEGITEKYIGSINKDVKELLTAVANINLGIEYTLPVVGLRLRSGFILNPSPYKDDPSSFDRKYLTFGAGILADETIAVDVAYVHGWWENIGDNYGSDQSRTFQDITVNRLSLSFSYRF